MTIQGTRKQRWIFEVVSLRSPDAIDMTKAYAIKNRATGKSLLVRSTYGAYPLHITSHLLDTNRNVPDYYKVRSSTGIFSSPHPSLFCSGE